MLVEPGHRFAIALELRLIAAKLGDGAQVLVAQVGFFIGDGDGAFAQAHDLGLRVRRLIRGRDEFAVEAVDVAQFAVELWHAALKRGLDLPHVRELRFDRGMIHAGVRALRFEAAALLVEGLARGFPLDAQFAQFLGEAGALVGEPRLLAFVGVDLIDLGLRLRIELRLLPAEKAERGFRFSQFAPGEPRPKPVPLPAQLAGDLPQPWREVVHLVVGGTGEFGEDAEIFEGGGVAGDGLPRGDLLEQAAHDFSGAGLGK